ncbi:MAG: bifunctional folylpolyglutamate synthase/dihydrofolate synthase [Planctomycetes bacterium]|nr:bifunctional folylpolyglutamate synthase/dihydrofolate synthase [Planctomycetota bacterium]
MPPIRDYQGFLKFLGQFTNYERRRFIRYDIKTFCLERMRDLSKRFGDPHLARPAIHVAGTKGKGSTVLMLEALLAEEGLSAGAYTSPHVEDLTERIRIGGRPIGPEEISSLAESIRPRLDRIAVDEPDLFPTFFELLTLLAMLQFAQCGVDWAIYEVGLGGRLDATNILQPRLAAITSIGLEHTQQLGDTVEQIAREKGGIIKERVPLVRGDLPPGAARVIDEICAAREVEVLPPVRVERGSTGGRIAVEGLDPSLPAGPVRGPALRANLGIALALHRLVLAEQGRSASPARVAAAVERLVLPGRVEIFPGDPLLVIDGAHTEESFVALRDTLSELEVETPRVAVLSLASDKRADAILPLVRQIADTVYLTRADPVRSRDPLELRSLLGGGIVCEPPAEAFRRAIDHGRPVVACGSMYLAGTLRPLAHRRPIPAG